MGEVFSGNTGEEYILVRATSQLWGLSLNRAIVPKNQNGRYFQYVFGTYEVIEEDKEGIIIRNNVRSTDKNRIKLLETFYCYITQL